MGGGEGAMCMNMSCVPHAVPPLPTYAIPPPPTQIRTREELEHR